MATSKIKVIKKTLKKAIDYIVNPDKTDAGLLVYSHGCSVETADIEMMLTAKQGTGRGERIAYHLMQSFPLRMIFHPRKLWNSVRNLHKKSLAENTNLSSQHISIRDTYITISSLMQWTM